MRVTRIHLGDELGDEKQKRHRAFTQMASSLLFGFPVGIGNQYFLMLEPMRSHSAGYLLSFPIGTNLPFPQTPLGSSQRLYSPLTLDLYSRTSSSLLHAAKDWNDIIRWDESHVVSSSERVERVYCSPCARARAFEIRAEQARRAAR